MEPPSSIARGGVDPFPQLPVDQPLDREFRSLFHHFFDQVFDRLAGIFRGPLLMPGYKQRMLGVALSNRAYCMGLITQAHTDAAISRGTFQETRDSLELYTKLIAIFRTQLASSAGQAPQPMQIEIALLILCILLSYNVTRGRASELRMNWNALKHLVHVRGGVHYLTVALAYVVHVDRLCATMFGVRPTYVSSPGRLHPFTRPPWSTYSPGFSGLEQWNSPLIAGPVLEQCLNTCELLALHEAFYPASGGRRAGPTTLKLPASPEYLYYLRDKVDEQFALLYAELLHQLTPSRCVLLATRIVEYPVTWANYVPTLTVDLCTVLCAILRRQDLFEVWSGSLDVLSWVLFVMLASPWPFDGRDWALSYLRGIVGAKYGADRWPENWRADELGNLTSFAWPEAYYAQKLEHVFRELETGTLVDITDEIDGQTARDEAAKQVKTEASSQIGR
jgi:hypothetical protein